jgi:hypothetical protein
VKPCKRGLHPAKLDTNNPTFQKGTLIVPRQRDSYGAYLIDLICVHVKQDDNDKDGDKGPALPTAATTTPAAQIPHNLLLGRLNPAKRTTKQIPNVQLIYTSRFTNLILIMCHQIMAALQLAFQRNCQFQSIHTFALQPSVAWNEISSAESCIAQVGDYYD